jgi:hypothetical protein
MESAGAVYGGVNKSQDTGIKKSLSQRERGPKAGEGYHK